MISYQVGSDGNIEVLYNGDVVDTITEISDIVQILNDQVSVILSTQNDNKRELARAEKEASDARWAADAANGLLRWGA